MNKFFRAAGKVAGATPIGAAANILGARKFISNATAADPFKKSLKNVLKRKPGSQSTARTKKRSTGSGTQVYKNSSNMKGARIKYNNTATYPGRKRSSTKKKKRKTTIDGRQRFNGTRKLKKPTTKYQSRTYLESGSMERDNALYFGVENVSSIDRLFEAFGEAIARVICKKFSFYPSSVSDKIPSTINSVKFFFRSVVRKTGAAIETPSGTPVTFVRSATSDFGDLVNFIVSQVRLYADQDDATPDAWGMYMHEVQIFDNDDVRTHIMRDFYKTMVDIQILQTVKLHNMTPNDAGAPQTTNAIGTNPLKGRVVDFLDSQPRIRDELLVTDVSVAAATEFQVSDYATGMKCISDANVGSYNNFAQVRDPRTIFSNVKGQGFIRMNPDQVKVETISFSCHSSIKQFIKKYASTKVDHGHFGGHKMFMLQLAMPSLATTENKIKVEYSRKTVVKCAARMAKPIKPLARIEQLFNANF